MDLQAGQPHALGGVICVLPKSDKWMIHFLLDLNDREGSVAVEQWNVYPVLAFPPLLALCSASSVSSPWSRRSGLVTDPVPKFSSFFANARRRKTC